MKNDSEIAKTSRERAKRQNERAKELWDSVTIRLPKGTKDRITATGNSVNGLINKLVLEYLEEIENN